MAYANTFKRCEIKFLLDEEQYKILSDVVSRYMTEDEFGLHTVMNIYMDDMNDDLIRASLGKPVYKEKLRLRTYGNKAADDSGAFLEIKKKFRGITYKRRLEGTYKELFDYVSGGVVPETVQNGQIFEEIDYMIHRLGLMPRVVICYDREAYYGNDNEEFRVTFDGNIRSRKTDLDLRSGDGGELLGRAPFRVMEVKSAGAVPMWLVKVLSENRVYHGSFSKYGTIYQSELACEPERGFAGALN